jgi:hypothetical protein
MQVILVMIECLRSDHLSCYGYERETTPFLDSVVLSRKGVMWSDFKSAGCETRATFGVIANYAKTVSNNRIHTSYYTGNAGPAGKRMATSIFTFKEWPATPAWRGRERPVADAMISAFIEKHKNCKRFFGILHFQETHAGYQPWGEHERFIGDETYEKHKARWGRMAMDGLTKLDKCGALLKWDGPDSMEWARGASKMKGYRVATHPAYYIAAYDGAIRFLDSRLGRLFDAFPEAEIFVTGDHGESLGERGFCIHAYGHFPELMRVPCIARTEMPLNLESRVITEPSSHRDMLNTILSRFKIKASGKQLSWPLEMDPEVLKRLEGLGYVGRS